MTARQLLALLLSLLTLAACKPREVVVTQNEVRTLRDTLRQHISTRDSIYLRDSIFVLREAIPAAEPSGSDTLRETKYVYKYMYRDRTARDSLRIVHQADTILVIEPDLRAAEAAEAKAAQYKAQRNAWRLYFFALAAALGAFLLRQKLRAIR